MAAALPPAKTFSRTRNFAAQNVITVICAHFVGGHGLAHGWSVAQGVQAREHADYQSGFFLNDFDVSCLANSSDATLQSRVGTEDFRSPLWQEGQQYNAVDDLASLVLSFAWLLEHAH